MYTIAQLEKGLDSHNQILMALLRLKIILGESINSM